MIRFSESYLRDKVYACWVGKNIGGTLGTPYEGSREMNDIDGFASKAGEPLPNDDLDLQLVWLRAVNDLGPEAVNSKVLGEYWLSYINPNWNEYGEGKANMRDGIPAPMCGEINNDFWRNSNGAWIRTEVWCCLYPAMPEKAIRYAFEDACVDHGYGEGTYAAIFIAAMESAAFVISDARALLDIGLSKIPETCRVAQAVKAVINAFDAGKDWKAARQDVLDAVLDLGWFQAPANVAFVVLGLLYGKGDFKQSLIYAIDCGDDTDCTGATLGALMGIMNGMAGIPADWQAYIGDGIKSICLTNGHGRYPETNKELTDCIFNLLPVTLRQPHMSLFGGSDPEVALGETNAFEGVTPETFMGREFCTMLESRKRWSYTTEGLFADALVEFDEKPVIVAGGTLSGALTMLPKGLLPGQTHYHLRWLLPEGWTVTGPKNLYTHSADQTYLQKENKACFTLTASDKVEALNRIIVEVTLPGRMMPILVPVIVLG